MTGYEGKAILRLSVVSDGSKLRGTMEVSTGNVETFVGDIVRDPSKTFWPLMFKVSVRGKDYQIELRRETSVLKGEMLMGRGGPRGWSDFGLVVDDTPRPVPGTAATIPSKWEKLVGAWDGAVFETRRGESLRVSVDISVSTAGVEGRLFDAVFEYGGRRQLSALMQSNDGGISFKPIPEEGHSKAANHFWGYFKGSVKSAQSRDSLEGIFGFNDIAGKLLLWRRPGDRSASLESLCQGHIQPWIHKRHEGRAAARDMKADYYPSLASYDVNQASLLEVLAVDGKVISEAEARRLLALSYECALTSPDLAAWIEKGLLEGFVDSEAVWKARVMLSKDDSKTFADVDVSSGDAGLWASRSAQVVADEAALPPLLEELNSLSATQDLLSFVERNADKFQRMRPAYLKAQLSTLGTKLQEAERSAEATRDAVRAARAAELMLGVETPTQHIPGSQIGFLGTVTSGGRPQLDVSSLAFVTGALLHSVEACNLPPPELRTKMLEIVKSGMILLFGTRYSDDLPDALRSALQTQLDLSEGDAFAEAVGCDNNYLQTVFALLSEGEAERARPADGRATRFERTCSLDRPSGECSCIGTVLVTLDANIGKSAYDRSAIQNAIARTPAIGLELIARCGPLDY